MENYEEELQNRFEKTKQEAEQWAKDYIQRQNEKQQQKRKANNELKEENKTQKQKISNDAKKLPIDNKQNDEEKMEQARKMLSFKNYHWQKAKNEILSDFTLTKDRLRRDALKLIKEVRTDRLASDAEVLQSILQNKEKDFKQQQEVMQSKQQALQNGAQTASSELEYELQQAQIEWMQKKMEIMQKEYESKQKILQAEIQSASDEFKAETSNKSQISQMIKKADDKVKKDKQEYNKRKNDLHEQKANAKQIIEQLQAKKEKERNNGMQLSNIIDTKNNTNNNITTSRSIPSVKENKQPSVGL